MIKYLKRTWKNKAIALAMMLIAYLSTFVDGDITGAVFVMLLALPLFFTRTNLID
jgi:hypothetical protein